MNEQALDAFVTSPGRAGIFTDFDGTLSRIVEIPSEARPIEGADVVLARAAEVFALVAVVSGRSAGDLLGWFGDVIEVWGVHGAERVRDGRVVLSDRAEPYRELMSRVAEEARQRVGQLAIPGLLVEDKTVMVGLHFRAADDVDRARTLLDGVADELVREFDLRRAGGRLAFELRPPETFTKEQVVLARAREERLDAVMFLGDDRVDIPAFEALDELATDGVTTLRVGVASEEAPAELIERADIVVDGPEDAVAFLDRLVTRAR